VRTLEELRQLQLRGLQWTVRHAYHGSAFYRQQWQQAGLTPEDVRSLDDLRRLPPVTARASGLLITAPTLDHRRTAGPEIDLLPYRLYPSERAKISA
jgi:hypothetical protein